MLIMLVARKPNRETISAYLILSFLKRLCMNMKKRSVMYQILREHTYTREDRLYRAVARALIGGGGGVYIHIFVFCPTNFF